MKHTERSKKTCVFCGKERTVEAIVDDGCDYYGHHYGVAETKYYDDGCDCALGKLEQENPEIRPMCLNCRYLEDFRCGNKKKIDEVSKIFEFMENPIVKNLTADCSYWELSLDIFKNIIKKEVVR